MWHASPQTSGAGQARVGGEGTCWSDEQIVTFIYQRNNTIHQRRTVAPLVAVAGVLPVDARVLASNAWLPPDEDLATCAAPASSAQQGCQ